MTVASETREAVRARPFLHSALRAGVLNYTAAARYLDVGDGDEEAVAAALRRYAEELPEYAPAGEAGDGIPRVEMESGVGPAGDAGDVLLSVGGTALGPGGGDLTAILVHGAGPGALERALGRLRVAGVEVDAAGAGGGTLVVVVSRRAGPDALRLVEDALS